MRNRLRKAIARMVTVVIATAAPLATLAAGGCAAKNGTLGELAPPLRGSSYENEKVRMDQGVQYTLHPNGQDANGVTQWAAGDVTVSQQPGMQSLAHFGQFTQGMMSIPIAAAAVKIAFWPETIRVHHSGGTTLSAPGIEGNLGYIGDQLGYIGDQNGYMGDQLGYIGDQIGSSGWGGWCGR